MKRVLKAFVAIILMINIISLTVLASSNKYEFDDYGMKKEVKLESNIKRNKSDWTEFDEKSDVQLSKEWTIKFSGEVTHEKIDGMVIEKDKEFIPVKIKLTGENQATVIPMESYQPNSKYILKIFLNNGKKYKMYFNTMNKNTGSILSKVMILNNKVIVVIDEKLYEYIGNINEVHSFVGMNVVFKTQQVNGIEYVYDIAIKQNNNIVVNKTNLMSVIENARNIDTTNKTIASIQSLNNALAAAELIRDSVNSTQAQVDASTVVVNQAITELKNIVDDNRVIEFKDTNLEKIIRMELSNPTKSILVSDVKNITKLYLDKSEIVDISPLKYFYNLEDLSIGANKITDITVLGELKKLKKLEVSRNLITDIEVLRNLTNLEELYLSDNKIININILGDLSKLQTLYLNRNQITDISPIGNLISLKKLDIGENNITNIEEVENLIELDYLSLSENNITNIDVLKHLTELENLHLSGNSIKDISFLGKLIKLEWLSINKNQITDIIYLKNLINLKILDIRDNQISDFTPLNNLTNIDIRRNETATYRVYTIVGMMGLKIDSSSSLKLSDVKSIKVNGTIMNHEFLGNYITIELPLTKVESVELYLKDGNSIKANLVTQL